MQIKDRKSELALLETLDSGKPLDEASADMVATVCILHYDISLFGRPYRIVDYLPLAGLV